MVKQHYLLGVGEVFDQNKHDESLKRVRAFFKKRGYWQVVVDGQLIRNEREKRIKIFLIVHKGPRFTVKHVSIQITGDRRRLTEFEKVANKHVSCLKGKYYTKYAVTSMKRFLKRLLIRYKMPCATIVVNESVIGGARLAIEFVVDVSAKNAVTLVGNKQVQYDQFVDYILSDAHVLSYISVPFLINSIKRYYQDHGFLMAQITARQDRVGWHLNINEGDRIIVRKISFNGVADVREKALHVLCQELIRNKSIDETLLQKIHDAIITYYEQQGFWDACIDERAVVKLSDGSYRIEFTIDEGIQRRLKKVVITSEFSLLFNELPLQIPLVKQPIPFDWHAIAKQRHILEQCINKHEMSADILYELLEEPDGTTLAWQIKKKQPLLFGKTIIMGNSAISHKRIMDLLAYKEGRQFEIFQLAETFKRINDLGVFELVRVSPLLEQDPAGNRPMVVAVDSGCPFEAQLRVGLVGTNNLELSTYTLGVSLLGKNLTSHADSLTINAELTRFCRDCVACYRYPRVGGVPLTLQIQLFDKKTDCFCSCAHTCAHNGVLYTALQDGAGIQADYYTDCVQAGVRLGVEAANITHLFEPCAQALMFDPAMRNHYEFYCSIEPSFCFTLIDDAVNPRCGSITHLGARAMVSSHLKSASFARLLAEQSFFVPFAGHLVGALRLRAGYIFCPLFTCLLPSERFYLGGPCSIRAYQQNYMPPLVCCGVHDQCLWMPLGSRAMVSTNAELRATFNHNIGVVLFQDIGALWHEKQACFLVGGATGVGIRYLTPIGPLRFDIGIKNKSAPDDCLPIAWFLTIGHAF